MTPPVWHLINFLNDDYNALQRPRGEEEDDDDEEGGKGPKRLLSEKVGVQTSRCEI